MQKAKRHVKKVTVAIIGFTVLIIGIIAIPYPGPGWLIVFTALAILATEFTWAQKVLDFAKGKYDAWTAWLKRQHMVVQILVLLFTGLVVVTTLWVLNVFGLINHWLDLSFNWIASPFFR
jgi:uncharacterized protein (TIGR02611 family)